MTLETCEATTNTLDPDITRSLKKCGRIASIESLRPVPAYLCFGCAISIHFKEGLTWRRMPRARKWHEHSPLEGSFPPKPKKEE